MGVELVGGSADIAKVVTRITYRATWTCGYLQVIWENWIHDLISRRGVFCERASRSFRALGEHRTRTRIEIQPGVIIGRSVKRLDEGRAVCLHNIKLSMHLLMSTRHKR